MILIQLGTGCGGRTAVGRRARLVVLRPVRIDVPAVVNCWMRRVVRPAVVPGGHGSTGRVDPDTRLTAPRGTELIRSIAAGVRRCAAAEVERPVIIVDQHLIRAVAKYPVAGEGRRGKGTEQQDSASDLASVSHGCTVLGDGEIGRA